MKRVLSLLFVSLLVFVAQVGAAATERRNCRAQHLVRFDGTELIYTTISLRNANAAHDVTIERLTFRDFFGVVVHDSGPAIGVPHPLNSDIAPPHDITVVPRGASFYLRTQHIWGRDPIPGGDQRGYNMTAVIEFSTKGNPALFFTSMNGVTRERDPETMAEGAQRSSYSESCVDVKSA